MDRWNRAASVKYCLKTSQGYRRKRMLRTRPCTTCQTSLVCRTHPVTHSRSRTIPNRKANRGDEAPDSPGSNHKIGNWVHLTQGRNMAPNERGLLSPPTTPGGTHHGFVCYSQSVSTVPTAPPSAGAPRAARSRRSTAHVPEATDASTAGADGVHRHVSKRPGRPDGGVRLLFLRLHLPRRLGVGLPDRPAQASLGWVP